MTTKTPEEVEAAKKEREGIKSTVVKSEDKEPNKETQEETEVEEETNEEVIEEEEKIETNEEKIENSTKTEAELNDEKAAAKTAAEKQKIQKRIDREVSKRKALETELNNVKAQLAAKETGEGKFTEKDVETKSEELANQKLAERDFNNACSRLQKAATKLDKDFPDKIKELADDIAPIPGAMIGILDDLDNGGLVLSHFTTDPDEYERIISLNPTKMAVELTKLSEKLSKPKPKPLSKVPAPNEPVGGGARIETPLSDKEPMADWVAKRNRQVEERRKAKLAGMR